MLEARLMMVLFGAIHRRRAAEMVLELAVWMIGNIGCEPDDGDGWCHTNRNCTAPGMVQQLAEWMIDNAEFEADDGFLFVCFLFLSVPDRHSSMQHGTPVMFHGEADHGVVWFHIQADTAGIVLQFNWLRYMCQKPPGG